MVGRNNKNHELQVQLQEFPMWLFVKCVQLILVILAQRKIGVVSILISLLW